MVVKMSCIIDNAIKLAYKMHSGQLRKHSNVPYIMHGMAVGNILRSATTDEEVISAGILHDILEDTTITFEELKIETTLRIAEIVKEVTRDSQGKSNITTKEGVMVKCADMIHNMSDSSDRKYIQKKVELCKDL